MAPTRSSPSNVATATAASRIIGKAAGRPYFYVGRPWYEGVVIPGRNNDKMGAQDMVSIWQQDLPLSFSSDSHSTGSARFAWSGKSTNQSTVLLSTKE